MKKTIFFAAILTSFLFTSCEKETYGTSSNSPTYSSGSKGCSSVQCYATAKSTGSRCKNKTTNCSGLCYQHQ